MKINGEQQLFGCPHSSNVLLNSAEKKETHTGLELLEGGRIFILERIIPLILYSLINVWCQNIIVVVMWYLSFYFFHQSISKACCACESCICLLHGKCCCYCPVAVVHCIYGFLFTALVVYLIALTAHFMLFSAGVVCCLCGVEPADRSAAECRRWRGPDGAQGSAAAAQWRLLPTGQPVRVQAECPAVCIWVPHDRTRCKILYNQIISLDSCGIWLPRIPVTYTYAGFLFTEHKHVVSILAISRFYSQYFSCQ